MLNTSDGEIATQANVAVRRVFILRFASRDINLLCVFRSHPMSFFGQFANVFSRAGREDNLMKQGMAHASANQPEKAIGIYDSLVCSKSATVRSRALFNRALAHSAMKEDAKAIADLEQVIAMSSAPENVLTAARTQLIRVRNRGERVRNREQTVRSR